MFMNTARPAIPERSDRTAYTAPTHVNSVDLHSFLEWAQRGPTWSTHQLDIFKPEATEPDNATLYYAGDLSLANKPCVSVVGKREASPQGITRAARLSRELVARGVVVVSGLAKGIDAAAHSSALENGGRTIGVIGTPLSKAYPAENATLQETIWREQLLISPFPQDSQVFRSNFPRRNKVMAAISDATVIVEADDNSGTLHQAVACQELGRWLFILKSVVDSRSWPNRFLHIKNAVVLERTDQIFEALDLL
jgi:DNA processing protein